MSQITITNFNHRRDNDGTSSHMNVWKLIWSGLKGLQNDRLVKRSANALVRILPATY